jgi:hypothetical protein
MARTSIYMTAEQKRAWAAEYDRRKAAGAKVRRVAGMEMVQADNGWFQRNGDACPGKGYDAQAVGDNPEYRKPPRWPGMPKGRRTPLPWDRR